MVLDEFLTKVQKKGWDDIFFAENMINMINSDNPSIRIYVSLKPTQKGRYHYEIRQFSPSGMQYRYLCEGYVDELHYDIAEDKITRPVTKYVDIFYTEKTPKWTE